MSRLLRAGARCVTLSQRSTYLLIFALSLGMLTAAIIRFRIVDYTPNVSSLLEEAEDLQFSLLAIYDADELSRVPTYDRAIRAKDQARFFAHRAQPNFALPHAQSALALFERTDLNVRLNRFNQLEASVIELQLTSQINTLDELLITKTEVFLRDAKDAANRGNWATAMSLLERVVTFYQDQGAAPAMGD